MPVWNNYSENTESAFRFPEHRFSPNYMHIFSAIMNIVSLFRLSSTLGALWEANMPFEIRHR